MEDQELLALIDRYLDGTLSGGELKEVERQIAEDADFRAEVELQRELREAYQDPGRLRLRAAMAEIMEEPLASEAAPDGQPGQGRKWILWLVLVLLLAAVAWYWSRGETTSPDNPSEPIQQIDPPDQSREIPQEQPVEDQDPKTPPPPGEETTPVAPSRPVAMADPADLTPNPAMDAMITSGFRSETTLEVTISEPAPDDAIQPGNSANIAIPFSGTIQGLEAGESTSLILLLFDNKDSNNPIVEVPFTVQRETTDPDFERSATLPARLGLYYFLVETEDGEVLAAGRFTIKN